MELNSACWCTSSNFGLVHGTRTSVALDLGGGSINGDYSSFLHRNFRVLFVLLWRVGRRRRLAVVRQAAFRPPLIAATACSAPLALIPAGCLNSGAHCMVAAPLAPGFGPRMEAPMVYDSATDRPSPHAHWPAAPVDRLLRDEWFYPRSPRRPKPPAPLLGQSSGPCELVAVLSVVGSGARVLRLGHGSPRLLSSPLAGQTVHHYEPP